MRTQKSSKTNVDISVKNSKSVSIFLLYKTHSVPKFAIVQKTRTFAQNAFELQHLTQNKKVDFCRRRSENANRQQSNGIDERRQPKLFQGGTTSRRKRLRCNNEKQQTEVRTAGHRTNAPVNCNVRRTYRPRRKKGNRPRKVAVSDTLPCLA